MFLTNHIDCTACCILVFLCRAPVKNEPETKPTTPTPSADSNSLVYCPKAKLYQQYCCDLCHVPLGLDKNVVLRHISTFKHPSVSLYNTRIESNSVSLVKCIIQSRTVLLLPIRTAQ